MSVFDFKAGLLIGIDGEMEGNNAVATVYGLGSVLVITLMGQCLTEEVIRVVFADGVLHIRGFVGMNHYTHAYGQVGEAVANLASVSGGTHRR